MFLTVEQALRPLHTLFLNHDLSLTPEPTRSAHWLASVPQESTRLFFLWLLELYTQVLWLVQQTAYPLHLLPCPSGSISR